MHHRVRACLAALVAAAALSAFVAGASANDLSTSSQSFEFEWDSLVILMAELEVSCEVTYLGSFHASTMSKVTGLEVAEVDHAEVGVCEGGEVVVLDETLSWTFHYQGFSGALPNIADFEIALRGASFAFDLGFATCLLSTSAEESIGLTVELDSGQIARATLSRTDGIDLRDQGAGVICDLIGRGEFTGDSTVENGSEGAIAVTLI
jgi:hypothetical protein